MTAAIEAVERTIATLAGESDALGKSWGWRKDAGIAALQWARVLEVLIPLYAPPVPDDQKEKP